VLRAETSSLWKRIGLINWAIRLCVSGALTVCLVIVSLFVGDFVSEFVAINLSGLIALLFVIAMLLIIAGLVFLLREISVATHTMREGIETALEGSQEPPASG
jgi:hypothetical protein